MFSRFRRLVSEGVHRFRTSLKFRSTVYYAVGSLFSQVLRFAGVIFSIRFLAVEDFGIFAQCCLVIGLAGLIRDLGQGNSLIACLEERDKQAKFHFTLNGILSLIGGFGIWGVVMFLPLDAVNLREVLPLLLVVFLVESLGLTSQIMAQKDFRFGRLSLLDVVAVGSWLSVLLLGLWREYGFVCLLTARLGEALVRYGVLFYFFGRSYARLYFTRERWNYTWNFIKFSLPENLITGFSGQLDNLLLSGLSSLAQLGLYERLQQFLRVPVSLSVNLTDRVALMIYSREQNSPRTSAKTLLVYLIFVFSVCCAATLGLSLVLPFLLPELVGDEWSSQLLTIWWFATPLCILIPVTWSLNIFFQGSGRVDLLLRANLLGFSFKLVAGVLLVHIYDAVGMVLAVICAYTATLIYQIYKVRPQFLEK